MLFDVCGSPMNLFFLRVVAVKKAFLPVLVLWVVWQFAPVNN